MAKNFLEAEGESTKEFINTYTLCPNIDKPQELYTASDDFELPFRTVRIKVMPCSLANVADCINSGPILSQIMVNFMFVETSFESHSKKNPLSQRPTPKNFRIGLS
jgi:hypothetical protein